MTEREFTGKVAVVAGDGDDLAVRIALRFAQGGATVVVAHGNSQHAAHMAAELESDRVSITFAPLDIRDPAQSARLIQDLTHQWGHLDIWVNVFETTSPRAAEDVSANEWASTVSDVLMGGFLCCQAAGRQMISQGEGVIVNVASVDGIHPIEGRVARDVADAGLIMLTKALGIEWAGRGVRVVGVASGPTQPLIDNGVFPENETHACRRTPMHRLGTTDEIAEAVVFMASSDASFVVAEVLRVDGGWTAYQLF